MNDTKNLSREENLLADLESLQNDYEFLLQQNQQLQLDLNKSQTQRQDILPLLQTIQDQQAEITSLNSQLSYEKNQNVKLLELSKNANKLKKQNEGLQIQLNQKLSELQHYKDLVQQANLNLQNLQSENDQLKLQILDLHRQAQKDHQHIQTLEKNLKTSADKFNSITNNLPNIDSVCNVTDAVKDLNSAIKNATKEIENSHLLNFLNFISLAIFLLVVGITCWQMFSANHTLSATSFEVTQIRKVGLPLTVRKKMNKFSDKNILTTIKKLLDNLFKKFPPLRRIFLWQNVAKVLP